MERMGRERAASAGRVMPEPREKSRVLPVVFRVRRKIRTDRETRESHADMEAGRDGARRSSAALFRLV